MASTRNAFTKTFSFPAYSSRPKSPKSKKRRPKTVHKTRRARSYFLRKRYEASKQRQKHLRLKMKLGKRVVSQKKRIKKQPILLTNKAQNVIMTTSDSEVAKKLKLPNSVKKNAPKVKKLPQILTRKPRF